MKILKNAVLSFFLAVSVAGISSVAMASENTDSADVVIKQIGVAKAAITAGKPNAEVSTLIAEAKSKGKKISASDKLASEVQRAAQHLSKAIGALKQNDGKLATEHLTEGEKAFTELKTKL
jgi:hypothetical protein